MGIMKLLLLAIEPVFAAFASAALFAAYTGAIAINLQRGRIHIDCGCGMARLAGRDQQLSWGLVVRNTLLMAAALVATMPASEDGVPTRKEDSA